MIYSAYLTRDLDAQIGGQRFVTDSTKIADVNQFQLDSVIDLATNQELKDIGKNLIGASELYLKLVREKRDPREIAIIEEQRDRYSSGLNDNKKE